jgi:murein DD-endopeptidase MepM/ murein hydrolase activator NlpD
MSESAAFNSSRIAGRLALASLLGVWLAGCSADSTRLSDPFANPFSVSSNDQTPPVPHADIVGAAAPVQPNANFAVAAHPSPVAVAALPAPAPPTTAAIPKPAAGLAVAGSANGWRAAGGSPVVVADGETLDTISRRYGVPMAALMKVNGLASPAAIHPGVKLIVPVYDASGKSAAAAPQAAPAAKLADRARLAQKKAKSEAKADLAKADPAKVAAKPAKTAAPLKPAQAAAAPAPSPKPATAVAKADAPTALRKKLVDPAPTGSVAPDAAVATTPMTGAEADAAGVTPEFRWPARGRIILGFKAGGNDGINIAVPEGTSVKAAESGVVAYAGSELKGYGNLVLIRHPNGFVSAYANNGELEVKRGDSVKRGQIIAKSGQSGNVSSPQLHFELRKGSTPVDPTNFLAGL